jgi:hypothetical protein
MQQDKSHMLCWRLFVRLTARSLPAIFSTIRAELNVEDKLVPMNPKP